MVPSPSVPTLLLLDDDPGVLKVLSHLGGRAGFDVSTYEDPAGALDAVRQSAPDVAMVDLRLPRMGGLTVITEIKRSAPSCEVLLMSGYATVETAVEAVKRGAQDCVTKPFDISALLQKLDRLRVIIETRREDADRRADAAFQSMIGRSPVMSDLFELIGRVAPHFTTALVTGETGTGKELVARALHHLGRRRDRAFLTVNCSAIVETLFESELFGHTRGAFTGAVDTRAGLFERANGGVVFLDEVGELPHAMQSKLLRVLETGEVAKVGSRDVHRVDVHVIAATNRDARARSGRGPLPRGSLLSAERGGADVPPLRDRLEDVPLLAAAFIERCARSLERAVAVVVARRGRTPCHVPWPGNVRELRNTLERACMLGRGDRIEASDLRLGTPSSLIPSADSQVRRIRDLERDEIDRALVETRGNKKEAAKRLGLSRRALYRRLDKFGLHSRR